MENRIMEDALYAVIVGGEENEVQIGANGGSIVGGGRHRIMRSSWSAFIGAGYFNTIWSNAGYAVITGGFTNQILDSSKYGVISGGTKNNIGDHMTNSVIAGGYQNFFSGSGNGSVLGGGIDNHMGRTNTGNTIAGGIANAINTVAGSCTGSSIGGGEQNGIYSADYAVIPGGYDNLVQGDYGFAAGRRASADHEGAFVWADSQNSDFASTTDDEVAFRCNGGIRFTSGSSATNQTVSWVPGSVSWSFSSDKNLKENFLPVGPGEVLTKVAAMPVTEWNYIGYPQRHIGVMAQDFHAAFPLEGSSDKAMDGGDLHGVTFAAIQGLLAELEELKARVAELEARAAQ